MEHFFNELEKTGDISKSLLKLKNRLLVKKLDFSGEKQSYETVKKEFEELCELSKKLSILRKIQKN